MKSRFFIEEVCFVDKKSGLFSRKLHKTQKNIFY
jgi:hypothetical protein